MKTKEESITEYNKGFNPFSERREYIQSKNFSLESILHTLDLLPDRKRVEAYKIGGIA